MMLAADVSSTSAATQSAGDPRDHVTRLHITPLDAELLPVVIPARILPQARNISFHTLQAFPEKRYGFVDLPTMEAEKLRKKLNGSTLKGTKVRLERARPDTIPQPVVEEEPSKKRKSRTASDDTGEGSKKRKKDPNVVEGVQLEEGRKIKRGWTVTAETARKEKKSKRKDDKKPKEKKRKDVISKYTDKEECLMKTLLPPNAANQIDNSHKNKKKMKGKAAREVVSHEFEHTTKFPSFLKEDKQAKQTSQAARKKPEYDVDLPSKAKRPTAAQNPKPVLTPPGAAGQEDDDQTSSSGRSSGEEEETSDDEEAPDSTTARDRASLAGTPLSSPGNPIKSESSRPKSSSSMKSLTIKIPPPRTPAAQAVHPLEALYKKKSKAIEVDAKNQPAESFSFFGRPDDDDGEPVVAARSSQPPMTPYTREDMEWRNTRSAAPTPDTAHPSRRVFWAPEEGDVDEDVDMEDENEATGQDAKDAPSQGKDADAVNGIEASQANGAPSDFQKWFWENRGDLNRSWMKRRKSAAKEKRQRENKARGSRAL